ncbi:hypothetical protein AB6A23_22235 [Paenibacillus tarimensis]
MQPSKSIGSLTLGCRYENESGAACHGFQRPLIEEEDVLGDLSLEDRYNRQTNIQQMWKTFDAKTILKKELIDLVEQNAQDIKLDDEFVGKVKARIKNALQVRLVSDLTKAKEYYHQVLGFTVDRWGHAEREGVGFLLQQAENPDDVRPNAKPAKDNYPEDWSGPPTSWDTYAYSDFDGVQSLYEEFLAKGAVIAYAPQIEDLGIKKWKEFSVKDLDGYVIVFGGSN